MVANHVETVEWRLLGDWQGGGGWQGRGHKLGGNYRGRGPGGLLSGPGVAGVCRRSRSRREE